MPPFVAFAGMLGGLAAVRWVYKTAQKINRELEEARLSRAAEVAQTAAPTVQELEVLRALQERTRLAHAGEA